jgi:hypothetical protein
MQTDLDFRGIDYTNIDSCHLSLVRNVRSSCESLTANSVLAMKAKAMNRHFYNQVENFSPFTFQQQFQISPGVFPLSAKSNAVVNLFGHCDRSCDQEHFAAVEWCADNRLGIGANLLKHAHLEQRFTAEHKRYLGIIIALDEELISSSGMSSAVASTREYQVHYDEIYGSVLSASLALINLKT